jgi:hypothetical protein
MLAAIAAVLGLMLLVPVGAGAGLYPGDWNTVPSVGGTQNLAEDGLEISNVKYAVASGNTYFLMTLDANALKSNARYEISFDYTPDGSADRSSFDSFFRIFWYSSTNTWVVNTSAISTPTIYPSDNSDTRTFEWKLLGIIDDGAYEWWGSTWQKFGGSLDAVWYEKDWTNPIATPIPAAAWLLGTGIVGLALLRRKVQK